MSVRVGSLHLGITDVHWSSRHHYHNERGLACGGLLQLLEKVLLVTRQQQISAVMTLTRLDIGKGSRQSSVLQK